MMSTFFTRRRLIVALVLTVVVSCISLFLAGLIHVSANGGDLDAVGRTMFGGDVDGDGEQPATASMFWQMGGDWWVILVAVLVTFGVNYLALAIPTIPRQ